MLSGVKEDLRIVSLLVLLREVERSRGHGDGSQQDFKDEQELPREVDLPLNFLSLLHLGTRKPELHSMIYGPHLGPSGLGADQGSHRLDRIV